MMFVCDAWNVFQLIMFECKFARLIQLLVSLSVPRFFYRRKMLHANSKKKQNIFKKGRQM